MLGTRTWGGRMEGADESTELWQHPLHANLFSLFEWQHLELLLNWAPLGGNAIYNRLFIEVPHDAIFGRKMHNEIFGHVP